MTERDELAEKVRAIISEHLKTTTRARPAHPVTDDAKLVCDLHVDSLGRVEITMRLEDFLDLELDDDAVSKLITVGDLVSLLSEKLGVGGAVG